MVGFRCFNSALAKESRAESVLARVKIQKFNKVQQSSKKFNKVQKSSKKFKEVQSSKMFKALFRLGSSFLLLFFAQVFGTPKRCEM
jgi:hypothetical protein